MQSMKDMTRDLCDMCSNVIALVFRFLSRNCQRDSIYRMKVWSPSSFDRLRYDKVVRCKSQE